MRMEGEERLQDLESDGSRTIMLLRYTQLQH